ncbi:MAG: DEAD/DEAH box helicase [Armatimonadota bacterium]
MSFASLGLCAHLCDTLADLGYAEPTPIQAKAIPVVLSGSDVLAGAQTGTGKTAAFALPLLQRFAVSGTANQGGYRPIRVLVLVPTRELAAQVEESFRTYGCETGVRSAAIFGGVNITPQIQRLRRGIDVLVATPGRLLDHVGQRTVDLSKLEVLVLDEADRMLDMGFIRDIRRILALLPVKRQNLLFSATFSNDIRALASAMLDNPVSVDVAPRNQESGLVEQVLYHCPKEHKRDLLTWLVAEEPIRQALVFTRTKHGADRLCKQLQRDGISAAAIHGDRSQPQRTRALADFKSGAASILVATDIAARGLDIEQLPHVVNFELPHVPEDYVHRIGRTGRAGSPGKAISLVCDDERDQLHGIERLLGRDLVREKATDFLTENGTPLPDPPTVMRAAPKGQRGGGSGRGSGGNGGGRSRNRPTNPNVAAAEPTGSGYRNPDRAPGAPRSAGTTGSNPNRERRFGGGQSADHRGEGAWRPSAPPRVASRAPGAPGGGSGRGHRPNPSGPSAPRERGFRSDS